MTRELGYEACFSALSGFIQPNMRGQILPREAMPCFSFADQPRTAPERLLDWFYSMRRRAGLL